MDIITLITLGLATWRIASLLAEESGPWEILDKLRHIIGVRYDEQSEPYSTNILSEQILCIWCSTPFIGLAFTAMWIITPDMTMIIAAPFAISAIAIYFNARGVRFRKRTF